MANIVPREINSADESSDGEHGVETSGKPVDRLKKKTKMQLNKKVGTFLLLTKYLGCRQG